MQSLVSRLFKTKTSNQPKVPFSAALMVLVVNRCPVDYLDFEELMELHKYAAMDWCMCVG